MLTATIYSITIFCYGLLLCLIRPFHPNSMHKICRIISWRSQEILGIAIEHRGMEHLQTENSAVIMSNHQNNFDVVLGASCYPPRTILIAKRSLFWVPFFGQFFWLSGNIFINRKNKVSAKASMEKVTEKVHKQKVKIWILPEGTRSKGRGLLPFKKGGFITAINCQIPIIPVVWSSYKGKIDFSKPFSGKVIISALKPISTRGLSLNDLGPLMDKVHLAMKNELAHIDGELQGKSTL